MDDKRKNGFPNLLGRKPPKSVEDSVPERKPTVSSLKDEIYGPQHHGPAATESEGPKWEALPAMDDVSRADTGPIGPASDAGVVIETKSALQSGSNNNESDLTEKDKREIYDAIDLIRRKLSFAKDFTETERANLMRLGKSGRTFVEKAQRLVKREPGILPRSFDVEEFNRDAELYQDLGNIYDELHKLTERVADTEAAVGSDAFTSSLVVYQSGKLARTGDDLDNHLASWRRNRERA